MCIISESVVTKENFHHCIFCFYIAVEKGNQSDEYIDNVSLEGNYDSDINTETHFNIGHEFEFNIEDTDLYRSKSLPTILMDSEDEEEICTILESPPRVVSRENHNNLNVPILGNFLAIQTTHFELIVKDYAK